MIKRAFWLAVGFLLGLGSSVAVLRRLRRLAARYAPAEVAGRVGGSVSGLGHDLRAAVSEGRRAMRVREDELRAGFGVPSPSNGHARPAG